MKVIRISEDNIDAWLHLPPHASKCGVVLTHGAGANCDSPLLLAVANALLDAGMAVLRWNLAFRQNRRFGPPGPRDGPADRRSLYSAAVLLRDHATGPVILGGHSYGGRQSSILAADEPELAKGLLLLSYPLHPPGKPDQMRTDHFGRIAVPALFVHGTNDAFATPDELQAAVRLIPVAAQISTVDGAGHDLRRGKFDVRAKIVDPLLRVLGDAVDVRSETDSGLHRRSVAD